MSLTRATYSLINGASYNVQDYGADNSGVADSTAAIQAAIDAAYDNYNKTIYVPNGVYKINGNITIAQGVMIMCEGSQGSSYESGTTFIHYNNGNCFTWDASGTAYQGTGGGLQNCLIVKADGYSGGSAVYVVNQDDAHRNGEMVFHNILIYGISAGRWEHAFHFDGTATNTPGARGVRSVYVTKCRGSDVSIVDETFLLNQVTHFYAHGLALDQGSGVASGIKLKGINDGVYLNASGIGGNLTIVANDASNATSDFIFDGKINGVISNSDAAIDGVINVAAAGGISNKSKNLRFVSAKKPGCTVYSDSLASNVTGDGTIYQVALLKTAYDQFTNWGGNSFTVIVAGRYKVSGAVTLTNVTSGHTRVDVSVLKSGSVSQNYDSVFNPYAMATTSGGNVTIPINITLDCDFNDVISMSIAVSNSTKTVSVYGSAGDIYSWLSIDMIP